MIIIMITKDPDNYHWATATTSCFVTVTDYLDDIFDHFDHLVDDFDVCEGGWSSTIDQEGRFSVEQFQSQKESVNPQEITFQTGIHVCVCDCICICVLVAVFIHVYG